MASQITSLTIVYSTVYSGADHRKHQSSASLAFVRRIHPWPVNSPHKLPVTQKMFPFHDVIMIPLVVVMQLRHVNPPTFDNSTQTNEEQNKTVIISNVTYFVTFGTETNWPSVCKRHSQIQIRQRKLLYFDSNSSPIRTNADIVNWRIYALLSLELNYSNPENSMGFSWLGYVDQSQ